MSSTLRSSPTSDNLSNLSVQQSDTNASSKKKNFPEQVWELLACFRSVQLAIVLISLLAITTMAGVMLPQDGLVDTAQIKTTFGTNYRLFKAMGFFNVYSSYWFIALEVLFFFNLLIGSFKWLKPAWIAATQTTFKTQKQIQLSGPRQLAFSAPLSSQSLLSSLTSTLKKSGYSIKTDISNPNAPKLYATKGNFSRLGPHTAHIGILLMLISSVAGVFSGFKAQELAVPGQTFDIAKAQMFKPNIDKQYWLGSTPQWKVHVNDFNMVYYAPGETSMNPQPGVPATVKQYYADLSIIDPKGKTLKRETISVNHPLSMGDVTLYQASFSPTGKLFVEVGGKRMTLQTNTQFMGRPVSLTELGEGKALLAFPFFMQQDPNIERNQAVFFLRDTKGFVGAKAHKMPPNLRLEEGQSGTLSGLSIRYVKPEIATGLQIKKGPEVPWMYLSYLIIISGTIMCIFSQRRIWMAIVPQGSADIAISIINELASDTRREQRRSVSVDGTTCASEQHSNKVDDSQLINYGNGYSSQLWISYLSNKAHISFAKELRQFEIQWRNQNGFVPLEQSLPEEPATV